MIPDVEAAKYVWMIECRSGPRLLLEAFQTIVVRGNVGREKLDRYVTSQPRVAGAPHFAHPACANLRDDGVLSDDRVRGNRFAQFLGLSHPQICADYTD